MMTRQKRFPRAFAALLVALVVGLGASDGGVVKRRSLSGSPSLGLLQKLRARRAVAGRRGPRYASDRVLIRFRPAVSAHYAEGLLKSYGFPSARRIPAIGVYSVRTAPGASVTETLAMLRRNPSILQARPDYVARLAEIPNDPYFPIYQHNLYNRGAYIDLGGGVSFQTTAGADIKAAPAWDTVKGDPEVIIAVLDTGVDMTHPELAAKIVSPGHDFVNDNDDATDDRWHGTHVAGIAAAETDNAVGIAGVAPGCRVLPVKVADAGGSGYYSWVMDGIIWAVDHGADVINISMGGEYDDPFLEDACRYAYDSGAVVVAAAGNDAAAVDYPAAYDDYVLAVASSDYNDAIDVDSSLGPEVDVAAPGVWVMGPIPQWAAGEGNPPYGFASGTSFAAPHVAGLAALIISAKPWLTPAQVMGVIRYTADDVNRAGYPGRDDHAGYGRINMERALAPYVLK